MRSYQPLITHIVDLTSHTDLLPCCWYFTNHEKTPVRSTWTHHPCKWWNGLGLPKLQLQWIVQPCWSFPVVDTPDLSWSASWQSCQMAAQHDMMSLPSLPSLPWQPRCSITRVRSNVICWYLKFKCHCVIVVHRKACVILPYPNYDMNVWYMV